MTDRPAIKRYSKNCAACNRPFRASTAEALYCSPACSQQAYRRRKAAREYEQTNWQPNQEHERLKVPAKVDGDYLYPMFNREGIPMVGYDGFLFRSRAGTLYHLTRARIAAARKSGPLTVIGSAVSAVPIDNLQDAQGLTAPADRSFASLNGDGTWKTMTQDERIAFLRQDGKKAVKQPK